MKSPVTKTIIALCTLGFVGQCVASRFGYVLTRSGAVEVSEFHWWQIFTYVWLHGNPLHLLVNLCVLWPFAKEMEERMSPVVFALGYIICGAGAALLAYPYLPDGSYIIGASGAVFGVVAMYGVMFFRSTIRWVFLPRPIPVWLFISLLLAVEIACSIMGYQNAKVHLGGILEGICFALGCRLAEKK